MDDCVIVLDAQNRIVGLNPAAHGLMNHTASEIIGQPVKLALPDLTAQLKLSAGGGPVEREAVLRIKESQRTFDVRVSPLTDRQGRLMSRTVVLREITHRKWTEERLEGSLSLLNATLESTADGILVVHRSGKTVGYNRKFLNMWHLPDSLVVWGNDLLSHEIVLNQLREPKEFLRKVEELYANPELEGYDITEFKDGRIFERYTQPRRVGDTIVGRVVSFRDITEHKRLQKQLHETKSHLENLLENANDAIYTLDLEGKLTYVNHRAVGLTGYSREELVGRDIASILHPDDLPERLEHLKRAGTGVPQITRLRFIRKEGDAVTLSMNETPIIKEGKIVGIFGIGRDITREVELEDQLRQAQKLEAVGQLAGGVAHDFNNLLTVILGHTELALMKTLDDSSLRKDLSEVKMAAERAADLTGQLLTFSRKQMIQPKVIDLNVTISRMNRLLRRLVREDIDFRVERAPELWRIMADPNQVEQVIVNLVVNARDAMPEGGTIFLETDNVEIGNERAKELGGIRAGRYVMLSVTDTGNGMSKEIQKRIFEPFFTTKPEGKGTGLGLSTVYGIVRQHKGGVWVHSRIGQGTTFKAYMPAVDGKDATERLVASPQIPRGFEETILVVEDEESVRGMVVTTLSELGYAVWEAHGGPQALAFLDEQGVEPDLLITDVVMPGIGGEKLAEECERRLPDVQILFISGYTDNAIHKDGVLKEGIEFLQKPFTPLSLALKVRELLANSKPAPR
jgi:PAS domain S-box-containing protein